MATITVNMPNGTEMTIRNLTISGDKNAKLAKSNRSGRGFLTIGLSLAPHTLSGVNLCPAASPGCIKACIQSAGNGSYPNVGRGRLARAIAFRDHREAFLGMLADELDRWQHKADRLGLDLAARLNVLSDVPWEKIAPWIFDGFPRIQFYDYTKRANRFDRLPLNYDLTFSRSETNDDVARDIAGRGHNVACVFRKALPGRWWDRPVISGEETDLRFLDPRGVIVGLVAKGRGRSDRSGFVIDTA